MAITFSTGTINQPDAGSVGLSMVEKLRDELVAHAAWDLVEEFTPASGQVRWYVFKCLASQSGMAQDWHVVIGRILGSGEHRFMICEDYAAGGHVASFFSVGHQYTSSFNFDSLGRYAATTFTLSTTPISGNPAYTTWAPSGTSTKYWITVDNDGFTVAYNGASNGFVHIGAYVPLTQIPILLPIQMIGYDGIGVITRNPGVAGATNMYGGAIGLASSGQGQSVSIASYLGFASYLNYNDKLQGNQRPVAEIGMQTNIWQDTIQVAGHGYVLGKQKRMRVGRQSTYPPGFAFGDAYVLNNRLWVPYNPTDTRVWDTGVAAS